MTAGWSWKTFLAPAATVPVLVSLQLLDITATPAPRLTCAQAAGLPGLGPWCCLPPPAQTAAPLSRLGTAGTVWGLSR